MSRLLSRSSLLWIACALALAAQAEAAPKATGSEAWTVSLQYGGGNVSLAGDTLERDVGLMSHLSIGHIVRRGVIAGFQVRSWSASETDSVLDYDPANGFEVVGSSKLSRSVSTIVMTATVFPTGLGFYVRGGAGVCRVRQEFLHHLYPPPDDPPRSENVTHEDAGFAVTGAAGWEYRFRRRLGIPLDVEYTRFVAAHVGGNFFSYTAGLNYYW